MTEKHYGGNTAYGAKGSNSSAQKTSLAKVNAQKKEKKLSENKENNKIEGYSEIMKAGEIAKKIHEFVTKTVKKGLPLLEIAEKIESEIVKHGGKPAFPVNLSINEIAAHDTPSYNDDRVASGLLKVDFGVHVDGYVADTAITIDLENTEINKKLIKTAQEALSNALEKVNENSSLGEIGSIIEKECLNNNLVPIHNLSGHSIEQYDLHAGLTVPNYDTKQQHNLGQGLFAIEPFVTNGHGSVRDGKPSGIYAVQKEGNVRDSFAREVLAYIAEEYISLPFCSRWIHKKFGTRGLLALKQIEQTGILHHYAQLVESGSGLVAQAEHTVLITEKEKIITTL